MNLNKPQLEGQDYQKDKEITLLDLFQIIYQFKIHIVVLAILGLISGTFFAYNISPVYKSEVLLMSQLDSNQNSNIGLSGLAALAGIEVNSTSSSGSRKAASALAILKSKTFLIKYIKENDIKPILFPNLWDEKISNWKQKSPSDLQAYKALSQMIIIKKKEDGLITYSVESESPSLSANLANNIIFSINNYIRLQAIEEAEKSILFLKEEINSTKKAATHATIYNIIASHTQSKTLANVRQEYAFKVIDAGVVPESWIRPIRFQIQVLGLISGIILGILFAFYRNFFFKRKII